MYIDIVISNVFNLNKKKYFLFLFNIWDKLNCWSKVRGLLIVENYNFLLLDLLVNHYSGWNRKEEKEKKKCLFK